jgi:pilus assembly protein CpaC
MGELTMRWTWLLASTLLCAATARAEVKELELGIGSQKILNVANLERLAVGDPDIADVKPIGNHQILVSGNRRGVTSLIVWQRNGQRLEYRITTRSIDACNWGMGEFIRLLGPGGNITYFLLGDHIYLEGTAQTPDDLLRVHRVTTMLPNVHSFVRVSPVVAQDTELQITHELQKRGYRDVRVHLVGTTIFLEGTVDSEPEAKKAELIAQALVPRGG